MRSRLAGGTRASPRGTGEGIPRVLRPHSPPAQDLNGTGKTFFLGHWEGDWHLRPDLNTRTDEGVTPESLQGMTDWLNTRQSAVDDAKRRTPHRGVQVYHYTEVNHVSAIAMAGRPCLTNRVLPTQTWTTCPTLPTTRWTTS